MASRALKPIRRQARTHASLTAGQYPIVLDPGLDKYFFWGEWGRLNQLTVLSAKQTGQPVAVVVVIIFFILFSPEVHAQLTVVLI